MCRKLAGLLLLVVLMTACHDIPEYSNDRKGNFEALWTILDQHYCFFAQKDVDWDEVHTRYAAKIDPEMTWQELFDVCSDMLGELKDGHVNLSSAFATSYYRQWWSDYPQNFSQRLVEESYFNFNYRQSSGLMYGFLSDGVGYIRYASFATPVGEGNLDAALSYLATATGLIIDIRDNGGGDLTNVERIVARFITAPTLVGYISHKTGPGHDDFSEPYPITYKPAPEGRVRWGKPVVVLTNRSCFSAANNFVSIMRLLPGVTIVGATTGGGSGMPFSSETPCGWGVRFSACSMLDAEGLSTEGGIEPDIAVDLSTEDALMGVDTMIEMAKKVLN
ncbi:MAG: S41 family peptidase [Muribaculaceae bacterium]|nr:S41 family peptidase [Muribaculaceae bacterium]